MKPGRATRQARLMDAGPVDAQPWVGLAGLVTGARVTTNTGERSVEALSPGDVVLTRSGAAPITRVEALSLVAPVVYVIAGSLSHNRTDRDALLIADQTIYLQDWRAAAFCGAPAALVEARRLIDGEFVRHLGQHAVTIHRVFCDTPQILLADGLELGTSDLVGDVRLDQAC
ncbi:Hint domain-containing protein [uncultured Roseobacter sp.]|uniref:Hint domain-containing protein n=1 Tax=uncultured Roseobacter sp. TaxID=114847 RepID=UPI002635FA75|nr:Hint domain-containing protein [uncultured Roseobacter sp.]